MTELVTFDIPGGQRVGINPEQVCSVVAYANGNSRVNLSGGVHHVVLMDYDHVLLMLAGKSQ